MDLSFPDDYTNKIICGDCTEVMKGMPDNCIDTIITDPPYNLTSTTRPRPDQSESGSYGKQVPFSRQQSRGGFMGKNWDGTGISFDIKLWKEILRIAKPGATLLCFGGTRTYHRLACAIEDAGWVIKDCIIWLTGQGFPKSYNLAKGILKKMIQEFLKDVSHSQYKDGDFQCDYQDNCHLCGELLHFFEVTDQDIGPIKVDVPKYNHPSEPFVKTLWDILHINKVSCVSLSFHPSKQGYLCHINGRDGVQENGNLSVPYSERLKEDGSVRVENSNDKNLNNIDVVSCEFVLDKLEKFCHIYNIVSLPYNQCNILRLFCRAKDYIGWGTALKPAFEPIIIAIKSPDGSYANNALKWGVAGLNIDGGRIPYQGKNDIKKASRKDSNILQDKEGQWTNKKMRVFKLQGRYPANVILDEEAGQMLDEQSGKLGDAWRPKRDRTKKVTAGCFGGDILGETYNDTGGASRFFYCAKASKAERNRGCEGLETKQKYNKDGSWNSHEIFSEYRTDPKTGELKKRKETDNDFKNHHPTVKPLSLMKYLCTLTKTPTGGIVLDPFCGSGTTLMACKESMRDYIGIDNQPEYCEIARRRVNATPEPLF